ncbi:hypothetical protein MKQ70_31925 [Chitinophaga sedimenti]|uniref:hypothetical protein n=1 Tax=Chitinophaga sedimenti TaxID=2033606 RepID=UPI002006B340|nr:hypothetical protein [Chitinophaga sedimenti]MCK7559327.1 hypothetical protein [Chitinophaga sedimenti]
MDTSIITVYIDHRPYNFYIDVNADEGTTTYQVLAPGEQFYSIAEANKQVQEVSADLAPLQDRLRVVEREQVARIIWQEIIDQLS